MFKHAIKSLCILFTMQLILTNMIGSVTYPPFIPTLLGGHFVSHICENYVYCQGSKIFDDMFKQWSTCYIEWLCSQIPNLFATCVIWFWYFVLTQIQSVYSICDWMWLSSTTISSSKAAIKHRLYTWKI